MPSSSAETQEPISPTTGAAISTLLSISLGSISIWMNFCVPGLPQDLPLPCDSSQLRRAPISITTSASFSPTERPAPAELGWYWARRPLGLPLGGVGLATLSEDRD